MKCEKCKGECSYIVQELKGAALIMQFTCSKCNHKFVLTYFTVLM